MALFAPSMSPQDAPDATLLCAIAQQPGSCRAEQEEFYQRHVRYLLAVVRKHCMRLNFDAHEVEDVVHDTFQRAFERAATFRASDSPDSDEQRRWSRAWLGQIARNLILAKLRAPSETPASDVLEHTAATRDSTPPSAPNPRMQALRMALESLGEREQDVLRVSALYHRAGHDHQRLPNEVSEALAKRWSTSNDNIRAIRSRALKKVARLTTELMQRGYHHEQA